MDERFLVFTEKHAPVDGQAMIVHNDKYETAQEFVQAWFEDHSVIRIYELIQCYAIGKVRGQ